MSSNRKSTAVIHKLKLLCSSLRDYFKNVNILKPHHGPSWPQEVWGLSNVECSDINDPMVGKILKKKNTTNFSIISLTYSHTLWVEINECRGFEEQTDARPTKRYFSKEIEICYFSCEKLVYNSCRGTFLVQYFV